MGEIENAGILYLDGKPLCLAEMPEITLGSIDTESSIRSFSNCRSCSMTGTFIYSKMSRKRFVHNLIKLGYSKKDAKQLSWYCNRKRIPYSQANHLLLLDCR